MATYYLGDVKNYIVLCDEAELDQQIQNASRGYPEAVVKVTSEGACVCHFPSE